MVIIINIELGVLVGISTVIISLLVFKLNKQKYINDSQQSMKESIEKDATENAELKTELRYIRAGVEDIRIDIKSNEKQMNQLGERVTRMEESYKSLHKRVDKVEGKANEN